MPFYFDVTELVTMRYNSGIQRVVREVVGRAATRMGAEPIVAVGRHFHRLTAKGRAAMAEASKPDLATSLQRDGRIKAALRHFPLIFTVAQRTKFHRRLSAMSDLYEAEIVQFSVGDTLTLIDSFWSGSSVVEAVATARRRGAQIVLVVYDLIPINHPELVSRQVAHVFPRVIDRALALAHGVVTISRQATDELLAGFPALSSSRVTHAYLGHDFTEATAADEVENFPTGLWNGEGRTYIMVGTIEPRKGHSYVLDGFEQLWADGLTQTLLIIGKPGWHGEDFLERVSAHPEHGKRLFVIHDASDQMLRTALARSDALIMASLFEGFGLPLVEALSAGRPVLASDIPVFREIADDAAIFFECGNKVAVTDAVRRFEADTASALARARTFSWPDWNEAADGFVKAIRRVLT